MHLDFISYTGRRPSESHGHSQIVLAVEGGMEIEVAGRTERLTPALGAFVAPGAFHSQRADRENTFLVLNCDARSLAPAQLELLTQQVFLPISPAVRRLIDYAGAARQDGVPLDRLTAHWAQLLLGSFAPYASAMPDSRLAKLARSINASLDSPWSVQDMAQHVALSPSRLFALFQEKWNTTPQDWLAHLRIKRVKEWLAHTDRPTAELAQAAGYADQSALTRAMRRITGVTPGAYRRQQQELGAKNRE